jgi:hypothetical protein
MDQYPTHPMHRSRVTCRIAFAEVASYNYLAGFCTKTVLNQGVCVDQKAALGAQADVTQDASSRSTKQAGTQWTLWGLEEYIHFADQDDKN